MADCGDLRRNDKLVLWCIEAEGDTTGNEDWCARSVTSTRLMTFTSNRNEKDML